MLSALVQLLIVGFVPTATDTPAAAGSTPARIEAFLEVCENYRRGAILQLEHELRGLLFQGETSIASKRRILEIKNDLRALHVRREPVVPKLVFPLKVGAIGRLPQVTCHVDQILSDRSMLVRCFFPVQVATANRTEKRGETVVLPVTFLVSGLPTGETHEGADIELGQVFDVTGKQTYKTVDGRANSAWVISELDMKALEPYFRNFVIRHP